MRNRLGHEIRDRNGERLYSRNEAAEALGLCPQTVSAYKRALGLGGRRGITGEEMEALRRYQHRPWKWQRGASA